MSQNEPDVLLRPTPEEDSTATVNPVSLVLHGVARAPFTIVALTILGAVAAFATAFSAPNMYASVGMILVRMGAREAQTPESAIDPSIEVRGTTAATADELLLLKDPSLSERVVELVGARRILAQIDPRHQDSGSTPVHIRWAHELQARLLGLPGEGSVPQTVEDQPPSRLMISAAVERVSRGTTITIQRGSNTIMVEAVHGDPAVAQRIAATYIDVFQDRHREFYGTGSRFTFVAERLREANERYQAAQQVMIERKEADGIYDLSSKLEQLTLDLQEWEGLDREDRVQISSLDRQIEVTDRQLVEKATGPTDSLPSSPEESTEDEPTSTADVDTQPHSTAQDSSTLLRQLSTATTRLEALTDEYATTSAYYQSESRKLGEKINSLKAQIELAGAAERARFARSGVEPVSGAPVSMPADPVLTELVSRQLDLIRQREAVEAVRSARFEIAKTQRVEFDRLLTLEADYERLGQDVKESGARAAQLEQAFSQFQTLQMIDTDERMANLMITQQPYLPTAKAGPDRTKILLGGPLAGLALGIGLAVLRQLLDRRVRYPKETEQTLGLAVLAVTPDVRHWRRGAGAQRKTRS